MSHGLVPMAGELLKEKRENAELKLGCNSGLSNTSSPSAEDLYKWSDDIFKQLTDRGDRNPKLTLAQSLDITADPCWRGNISTERDKPRHRVIARFAREGLWDQIWSLNWDCIQESAFENVGIKRDGTDAQLEWPTVFHVFVTAAECAQMGASYSVKIVKPHGCVMALVEAEAAMNKDDDSYSIQLAKRFLIKKTELESLAHVPDGDETQEFIFATLHSKLSSLPFVIAGWKASEKYILDYIERKVRPTLDARTLAIDELSIIVPTFRDTDGGHERLAKIYSKDKHTTHIPVDKTDFTMDRLFLWLQALYAIGRLDLCATDADKVALAELTVEIQQPPDIPLFIIDWVDNFLPVWVRLCWRCGLVRCRNRRYEIVIPEDINMESRDEHIPWKLQGIERPELIAASRLLAALQRSDNRDLWSFEMFPGGLYRDNQLIIPLPTWNGAPPNDLRGLKVLIDAIKQHGDGYIERLGVLFLASDPTKVIPDTTKMVLKELVARDLAIARFARSSEIEEIELEGF